MDKNSLILVLFALLALAALAFLFYSSTIYGKAGYIGTIMLVGRVDDSNGKPIWTGGIVGVAGNRAVGRGKIKGSYRLHFPATFEKDINWYKDKPLSIYVNGKLCTTLDFYKFVQDRGGGVIAQENLNLKCGFAQSTGRYG